MKEIPCIRIGHLRIIDHLILGIAGLKVQNREVNLSYCAIEPVAMNAWEQLSSALASREIDGAFITAPLAMDLFASGLDIHLLMLTHRSGSMVVKNSSRDLSDLRDFKGKTFLVPSEACVQTMLLHRLFSSASIELGPFDDNGADVLQEQVSPAMMPEMLAHDADMDIAGFTVPEPYGSLAVREGTARKVCLSDKLWKAHPCSVFVMHSTILEDHPPAVNETVRLFVSTGSELESREDKELFAKTSHFLKTDRQIAQNSLLNSAVRFDPSLLIPDMEELDTIANYMKDPMGVLKNDINMEKLVNDSFIMNSISDNEH